MATSLELLSAQNNDVLKQKVLVSCFLAAEKVRTEVPANFPNHAARIAWAKNVFLNPETEARRMVWAVIAQNSTQTLATIIGATDSQVQAAVDAAVDVFAG